MLTIYDAVAWETMPKGAPILVYKDPPPAINTEAAIAGLHPSEFWTISALGNVPADIADVESGDMSPGRAAFGVRMGWWHTVYCALDTLPSVQAAMKAQGSPTWYWFAADPTGVPHLPPGASACQYAWHSLGQCPANYDMSVATERWVSLTRPIPPTQQGVKDMQTTQLSDGRLVTPAIGAGVTQDHLFLVFTDPHGGSPSVIDISNEVGPKGPNGGLYTFQPS